MSVNRVSSGPLLTLVSIGPAHLLYCAFLGLACLVHLLVLGRTGQLARKSAEGRGREAPAHLSRHPHTEDRQQVVEEHLCLGILLSNFALLGELEELLAQEPHGPGAAWTLGSELSMAELCLCPTARSHCFSGLSSTDCPGGASGRLPIRRSR